MFKDEIVFVLVFFLFLGVTFSSQAHVANSDQVISKDSKNNLFKLNQIELDNITTTPVEIDGNADFNLTASNEGWFGNGSEGNPYVLDLDIDGSSHPGTPNLLEINNTDVHFRIQGYIYNGVWGIVLGNVSNAVISDAHIYSNGDGVIFDTVTHSRISAANVSLNDGVGIQFINSHNNTIEYSDVCHNSYDVSGANLGLDKHIGGGIVMDPSNNNQIISNTICGNDDNGIKVEDSSNVTISGNHIFNNSYYGVFFQNTSISSVDGNMIYQNGGGDTTDISPSYLGLDKHIGGGIVMDPSNYNNISNNKVYDNLGDGIYLYDLKGAYVSNNEIYANLHNGIYASYVNDTTIISNTIYNNTEYGILLDNCDSITLNDNSVFQNGLGTLSENFLELDVNHMVHSGLGIFRTFNAEFRRNFIFNNYGNGIHIENSSGLLLISNSVFYNALAGSLFDEGKHGVYSYYTENSLFQRNSIHHNFGNGAIFSFLLSSNITANDFSYNLLNGLVLENSDSIRIIDNTAFYNGGDGFVSSGNTDITSSNNNNYGNNNPDPIPERTNTEIFESRITVLDPTTEFTTIENPVAISSILLFVGLFAIVLFKNKRRE